MAGPDTRFGWQNPQGGVRFSWSCDGYADQLGDLALDQDAMHEICYTKPIAETDSEHFRG